MNKNNEIRIYKLVSSSDFQRLFPALRMLLFGMNADDIGTHSCKINENGEITFIDKTKLFGEHGSVDTLKSDAEATQLGRLFIDRFNSRIKDNSVFQKEHFSALVQMQYLKPAIVKKAINPFNKRFDHYILQYSFLARPSQEEDNVPVFDASLELRIDGSKSLVGFYYKWRPIADSFAAKRYSIYFQENPSGTEVTPALEQPQLSYKYDPVSDYLAPYYLGVTPQHTFHIPASEYSDKNTFDTVQSPLSISSDKWLRSDYNEILKQERVFELAVALNDFNPNNVEGWSDFKRDGQYYNPFKWYNYKANEQPNSPNSNIFPPSSCSILGEVGGYVFYDTITGNKLYDLVSLHLGAKLSYFPDTSLIRQMFVEANMALFVPNTELGGLIVGNFDFVFDGSKCVILVRLLFQFEEGIRISDHPKIRNSFFSAIAKYWTNTGYGLLQNCFNVNQFIPIHIYCQEVHDSSAHKVVDVHADRIRNKVIADINIDQYTSLETIAHEFGHVLGLYDEYKSNNAIEQSMFWKNNVFNADKTALMNQESGNELRDRYFQLYLNVVSSFNTTCQYEIGRLSTGQ